MPGVEIRIVDPDTDDDVEPGVVGELWVRSPQNVRDGWLQTGDLAYRDVDGYVYPQGRRGDLINRGGEKFAPAEVAEALRAHPPSETSRSPGSPTTRWAIASVCSSCSSPEPMCQILMQSTSMTCAIGHATIWHRSSCPRSCGYIDVLPVNELGKLPARTIVEHLTIANGGTT